MNQTNDCNGAGFNSVNQAVSRDDELAEVWDVQIKNLGTPLRKQRQRLGCLLHFLEEGRSSSRRLLDEVLECFEKIRPGATGPLYLLFSHSAASRITCA